MMYHRGGDISIQKLKSVELPAKIKCSTCKKPKKKEEYSKRQLNDLAYSISQHGNRNFQSTTIKCRVCTGTQVTELHCCMCDQVKGLEAFSKAQRSYPDNARCQWCVDGHINTEPNLAPADSDSDCSTIEDEYQDDGDTISNPYGSEDGTGRPADTELSLSINGLTLSRPSGAVSSKGRTAPGEASSTSGGHLTLSTTSMSTGGLDSSTPHEADGWVEQPRQSRGPRKGIPYTAYDPQGRAHQRVSTLSTVKDEEPARDTGRSQWARVKAAKPQVAHNRKQNTYEGFESRAKSSDFVPPVDDDDVDDEYMPEW